MTINVQLDDDLARKLEAYAQRTGQDMQTLVQGSLRETLAREEQGKKEILIPARSLGVKPGIDFSNNRSWRDALDESDERLPENRR